MYKYHTFTYTLKYGFIVHYFQFLPKTIFNMLIIFKVISKVYIYPNYWSLRIYLVFR